MVDGPAPLRIDFISDITCPWCAIGLEALEQAVQAIGGARRIEWRLQPFELNPGLPVEGEPIARYAARKHGVGAEAIAARQAFIRQRAAAVGLDLPERTHVYNTFDAHRLVHWAGLQGQALALKRVLLRAYHVRRENPALPEVLLRAVEAAGLDVAAAREVLQSGRYGDEVRATVRRWQQHRIDAVPTVLLNGRRVAASGPSAADYEAALRQA